MLNSITSSAILSSIETRAETNYQDINIYITYIIKIGNSFLPNTLKIKIFEINNIKVYLDILI